MLFSQLSIVAALLGTTSAALIAHGPVSECANEQVVDTAFIGANKDVKITLSHCANEPLVNAHGEAVPHLAKRQSNNVCGNACNTFCWASPTGGPTVSDCTVIADALLYESQNTGVFFNATAFGTSTNKITMTYNTCQTYFLNQDTSSITYCRTEWSKLVNWLASDCGPTNNAHGGLCVAADQRWYVQLQHN